MKTTLSQYLPPSRRSRIICLEETESTNTYLKNLPDAPDGLAVIARRQSAGRGRVGRSFLSPEGGIYLSLLHCPGSDFEPGLLTAGGAVAVCRAIERVCGVQAGIKWVNDLVLGGRKICGILTEAVAAEGEMRVIIGVGLNVNTPASAFEGELGAIAGSILTQTGQSADEAGLAAAVIEELDAAFSCSREETLASYRARCVTPGREVLIRQGGSAETAFAEAVDEDFALIVRYPDGRRGRLSFGEASIRGENGEYV